MQTICISLSGGIVSRRTGVNVSYIKKLAEVIKRYSHRYKFIITVGGGYASRLYIKSSKRIIKNEEVLDEIAIAITRINALIVKDMLSEFDVYPNIVTTIEELRMATKNSEIVVLGGLLPGMSTDAVAALACEVAGSKLLLNVSNEGYVWDKPPSEHGAKRMPDITHNDLITIATKYDTREAGSNFIFDLVASKLTKRGNIEIRFVNNDIQQLALAMEGKRHKGSIVIG